MKHVVRYDVYLDILFTVSIYVIKYWFVNQDTCQGQSRGDQEQGVTLGLRTHCIMRNRSFTGFHSNSPWKCSKIESISQVLKSIQTNAPWWSGYCVLGRGVIYWLGVFPNRCNSKMLKIQKLDNTKHKAYNCHICSFHASTFKSEWGGVSPEWDISKYLVPVPVCLWWLWDAVGGPLGGAGARKMCVGVSGLF